MTAEHSLYLMASNDKTAMRVVASAPDLRTLRAKVAGRVICMETVTRLLLENDGPETVARAFGGSAASDKRLATILSMGAAGQPDECFKAVESFLHGLCKELGVDFLWNP